MLMLLISAIIITYHLVVLAGRMVTMILSSSLRLFCETTFHEHHFGHFVSLGILGAILGFYIICCGRKFL